MLLPARQNIQKLSAMLPLKVQVTIFEKLTRKIFSVSVKITPEKTVTRGMKFTI